MERGNVAEEGPLSFAEVQRLHSETALLDTKSPSKASRGLSGAPPVLDESEVNSLLNSMDKGEDFIPDWAKSSGKASGEPSAAEQLETIRSLASDIESSMGTLDDKVDNAKSSIEETYREVEGIRADVAAIWEDVGVMKSQLAAIQEDFTTIKKHFAALFRLLTTPGALGMTLGIPRGDMVNADSVPLEPSAALTMSLSGACAPGAERKTPPVKTAPAKNAGSAARHVGVKISPSIASFMTGA